MDAYVDYIHDQREGENDKEEEQSEHGKRE